MSVPYCRAPSELPDLRLWLLDQWRPGRTLHDTAAPLLESRGLTYGHPYRPTSYALWEHDALRDASLWWIGPEMVDLLLATAAGVPDDAMFGELRSPQPAGLIVFAKPWRGIDSNDATHEVVVDAMLWAPSIIAGKPCLTISSYRRLDFGDGMDARELELAVGTGALTHGERHPIGTWSTRDGRKGVEFDGSDEAREYARHVADTGALPQPIGDFSDGEKALAVSGCSWAPLGRSDWIVTEPIDSRSWPELNDRATASYVEDRKVLAALWTLLTMPGLASRTEHADRASVRRSQRAKVRPELARVQVVRLRELPTEGGSDRPSTGTRRAPDHRTLVGGSTGGFYRWQACGKNRAERRLTFIAPFIRGPKDKPLHVPEKVNAWVR